jgi:outer membrane protein assembly factor BamB
MFIGAADHKMHAVADNGTWLWGFKTGGRIYSSPVPHGDDVYFGSDDGSLYKVDVDSGILIWEFESGDRIRSAPALWTQGNQIRIAFASYDGHLYCVDGVTGQAIWKSPIAKYTRSSPAIASAGNRIYMADESGKALCFDTVTGKELWNVALDGYLSRCPLVTPDGVAFVTDQGHAALINVSGGVVWQRKLGSRLTAQPAATATQLLIPTEEKLVVLIRKTGQPDARFVTTDLLPNLVDVTPYKDRLYFTQRNVLLVEFGNRSFTEFRSQAGIWQKEATE